MIEEKTSTAEAIARSVEKISDSRGIGEIGKGLGIGLVAIAAALAVGFFFFGMVGGTRWDGHLYPQTKCYEVKEIAGKTYKINSCTGDVEELKANEQRKKD